MRSLVLVLLLGTWAGPRSAAAAGPDNGAAAANKRARQLSRQFSSLMAKAKAAAKKGKHAAAIALYDQALAIRPGDAAALTDQGWSAFLLPDLPRAERITRQAVQADDRRISAAAHYNLGRILEARSDRTGAVAAYQRSLELRPNRVVREQLGKLDPAAAAAADPLKPQPMLGPFAKLADFCKTQDEEDQKDCPAEGKARVLTKIGPPYQAATWIQVGSSPGTCFLALQLLKKGWFVEQDGSPCGDSEFLEHFVVSFEATDLVPGGNREVVLRAIDNISERQSGDPGDPGNGSMAVVQCEGWLTACGVGKTGVPSCLRLQTGLGEFCRDDGTAGWDWQLQPVFSADGQVEVKATGKPDADARALMGRRPLAFP
jgi:hypothetical protein